MSSPCSSSPEPSPREILRQLKAKGKLAPEVPIPPKTTTSTIDGSIWDIPEGDREVATPSKPAKTKSKRNTKSTAKTGSETTTKATKPRKPRVTKPKTTTVLQQKDCNKPGEQEDVRSAHFAEKPLIRAGNEDSKGKKKVGSPPAFIRPAETPQSPPHSPHEPLQSYRRQWTPLADTYGVEVNSSPPALEKKESFGDKIAAFRCSRESSAEKRSRSRDSSMPAPRKRSIDLVAMPNPVAKAKPAPARKPRKPRKQATTAPASSPITTFFPASKKSGGSGPAKRKGATKPTTKKKDEPEIILLSPETAQQNLDGQVFVFGTCSQLEQDQSQTQTKDKEAAEPESPVEEKQDEEKPLVTIGHYLQQDPKHGLWDRAKGKREITEGWERLLAYNSTLNEFDDLNLPAWDPSCSAVSESAEQGSQRDSPGPASPRGRSRSRSHSPPFFQPHISTAMVTAKAFSTTTSTSVPPKPPKITPTTVPKSRATSKPPATAKPRASSKSPVRKPSPKRKSVSPPPTLPAAPKRTRTSSTTKKPSAAAATEPTGPAVMPDFSLQTVAQLQPLVTGYGFKKSGSKASLIAILKACWTAQHNSAPLPQPPSPKRRRRSRSRSPRVRSRKAPGKARPEVDTDARLSAAMLNAKISEAVRGEEGKDRFWERILMYDPIILEELVVWLNTGGLGKVGVDEEVTVEDARDWCDSRSVVAVSRETHRKKERVRY